MSKKFPKSLKQTTLRAWAIRNKHGGWIRTVWLHHAQLGETEAKYTLDRLRKKDPEMKYRLVVVDVKPDRFIPHRTSKS